MRPRARRALRWVAGIVGVHVLLMALLVASFVAGMSGGWDDLLDWNKPLPDDPEVVAARAAGAARIDAETHRVVDNVVLPALSAGRVAQPAATGAAAMVSDRGVGLESACHVGQHNWKIDDPYDLYCIEIRRTVLAGSKATFSADMADLHTALLADGWAPRTEHSDLLTVVTRARAQDREFPSEADYVHPGAPFDLEVEFQHFDYYTGRVAPTLAADEYAVMVSISHESFRA